MNILIFSWRGPGHPNSGGAEQSTHEHAKGWVKRGHKVTLFTSHYRGARREEILSGVKIVRSGRQYFDVQVKAFLWYLFGSHEKFDLVVDEFHGIPFFTPLYARAKKLGWIHEVAKEVWWLNPWPKPFNLIPAFLGSLLEPLFFKVFYKDIPFMTVSESTKKDLISWGIPRKNITVVENGVNLIRVKARKEKKKTVVFLGALAKDKGIEDAIRIFSLINQSSSGWQFWVIGASHPVYLKKIKNLARDLGLKGKIKFWGFVSEREKFELLARAHVMVNPSIREGWGLVNIEANSVGTPVVAYNVPGCRDSIVNDKTGILVPKGQLKTMVTSSMELVENKYLYDKTREQAISWSKKFSWRISSEKSLVLIESL